MSEYSDSDDFTKWATPKVITGLKLQRQLRPTVRILFPDKTSTQQSGIVGQLLRFEVSGKPLTASGNVQEFFFRLFNESVLKQEIPFEEVLEEPVAEPEPPELEELDEEEGLEDYDYEEPTELEGVIFALVWGVFVCTVSEICVVHVDQFNNWDEVSSFDEEDYLTRYHDVYYPNHEIESVTPLGFKMPEDEENTVLMRYDIWQSENMDAITAFCEDVRVQPRSHNV